MGRKCEMDIKEIESECVDWINLAKNRDRWQALVNAVMKILVPYNGGNFLSTMWFKYDRDYLCVKKSQFVPVIFEPPCSSGTLCLSKRTASRR
jgi:hypothetical protein